MGNTASTLQPPGEGEIRSRSPSVRRSHGRDGSDHQFRRPGSASSSISSHHRVSRHVPSSATTLPGRAADPSLLNQQKYHYINPDSISQAVYAPLPTLNHPHPQSHAYAFAHQASLEPGRSAVHSHPYPDAVSPGPESQITGVSDRASATSDSHPSPTYSSATLAGEDDTSPASRTRSVKLPSEARGTSSSTNARRSASVSSPVGHVKSGQLLTASERHGAASHLHQPSPLRMELSPPAHGTRRRTHEGLQLGMGFDPTTVVSSNPTTPLVATQNRHASGTPSHLEPAHPSTAFSALDVRTLGNVASELGGTATSGIPSSHLERPKFQKRESGSGTPTQMEATDPFNRTLASSIAAQPLPLHRPPLQNASETEFGIGDDIDDTTMLNSEMHGLDLSKSIAIPGSSAITDDDVPSPPELRTDALGRTLPAALPSYLRIPTTSMVDEDNSLDFLNNVSGNTGGAVDAVAKDGVDQSGLPSGGGGALAEGKRSSIVGPTGGRAQNVVPFMAILLTWRGGGHNVSVTGTFANEWRSRIPLSRNTSTGSRKDKGEFSCLLHLPPGTHRLKFLVDDRWRISQDLSTATDGEGNLVNYVEIPNVGPAHTGPLSAPGEDLPDEVEKGRGDEDFRFPPAYLRASRLGKAALTHPDASQGLQSPTGLEQELESGTAPSQHGKGLTDDSPMPAEELIQHSQGRPSSAGEGSAKDGSGNRTSYYAESTGSSTGASSGVTATGHHHDLKFTPLTATRMDIDDELLDGDEKKKKDGLASWTRDIPEKIIQAQIAEEMERERLEALAASGTSPPSSHPHHHHHHHHHGHPEAHLPAPPSLPRQLEKVILNSGPSGLAGAVDDNSVLPAPNHVVLSHLTASSIKGGVLAVGTTTRYKRKYVTTVFHRPVR